MLQYSPEVVRPIAISLKPITSSIIIPIRLDIVGIFPASATVGTVTQQLKKKLLTQLETIVECIEVHVLHTVEPLIVETLRK